MKTNDLKKGARVLLGYGDKDGDLAGCHDLNTALMMQSQGRYNPWEAVVFDNKKGNTRDCEVHGFETEIGSVYAHDILAFWNGSKWEPIEHTPAQLKLKAMVEAAV